MLTAYHYSLFDFRSDVGQARLDCTDWSVNSCNIGQVWTTQVLTTELDNLPGWSPGWKQDHIQSVGSDRLREFVMRGGLAVAFLDRPSLVRAFELMEQYPDHPMDLADASLIAAAESLETRKVFTLDENDFGVYRIRRGHRHYAVEIIR